MPREYNSWDINPKANDKMVKSSEDAMYKDVGNGSDVSEVVDRVGKQELINRLAGTTDKKTRAYKSARDKVQRWVKGSRNPRKDNAARMRAMMEEKRRAEIAATGQVNVKIKADFRFSSGKWDYVQAPLTGDALTDYLSAMERGDVEMATQIVAEQYGIDPNDIEGFDGFEGIDMDW